MTYGNQKSKAVETLVQSLVGLFVFLSGAALSAINVALQQAEEISFLTRNILGPMGLLVGALLTVWFLVRYLQTLQVKYESAVEARISDKERQIEMLRELIEKTGENHSE